MHLKKLTASLTIKHVRKYSKKVDNVYYGVRYLILDMKKHKHALINPGNIKNRTQKLHLSKARGRSYKITFF